MMYWVFKKIGLFSFLTMLKMELAAEGERCLALIVLGSGWVPGALPKVSRPGSTALGYGERLMPFLLPAPTLIPRRSSAPVPSNFLPLWPH